MDGELRLHTGARAERSETAKGRSLCPKGSAGGRWQPGWPEHFIFWELPLARLLQYQHCALRAHDVWTVPVAPPATTQLERLLTGWTPHEYPDAI